ncbi:MAG: ATP-binding cassette domain-containing protein [Anaerolineae bacterium]|nr:ATP-binding cassette domain-containing protein [Anaerolineae bacterium]
MIHLDDITLRLGEGTAFAHTTWRMAGGERWALLGESGAGKTLLVNALCGLLPLAGGVIRYAFDGIPPRTYLYPGEALILSAESHRAFVRRYVAYHQARWQSLEGEEAPTVDDLLSARSLPPPPPGTPAPKADDTTRRQTLVDLLRLEHLLPRRLIHLSHGETRKVFLARLLLQQPRLLVLDSPYSGMDAATCQTLRAAIETLITRQQPPVLFVTSRAEDIPTAADHLAVVRDLRLVYTGSRSGYTDTRQPAAAPPPASPAAEEDLQPLAAAYTADLPPADGGALLRMRNICVRYGQTSVLEGVDWEVQPGERWALLGPNGAGKTTLLSLVLGDNPQGYHNDLWLFGRRRGSGESIWEIKEKIGWVSPELHLCYPPQTSCFEVVCSGFYDSVGLHRAAAPHQLQRAAGWLRALGLAHLADKPFHALSAAQQRLALLGRALVKHPQLLILDEPCAALDIPRRQQFTGFLDRLCARAPLTLIYVTHDPDELPACITHTLRLEDGRVVSSTRAAGGAGVE